MTNFCGRGGEGFDTTGYMLAIIININIEDQEAWAPSIRIYANQFKCILYSLREIQGSCPKRSKPRPSSNFFIEHNAIT